MKLGQITPPLGCEVLGSVDIEITGLSSDSRNIVKGTRQGEGVLFAAIPGEHVDGHSFIADASSAGAAAILAERKTPGVEATQLIVPDVREALSRASDVFYGEPSREVAVIGITGTNGKTTSAYLVESILLEAGMNPGVIGTVNYRYNGSVFNAPHTTPQAPELQKMLREMADSGVTHCVMEVSSHALEQKRAAHLRFRAGAFTNLTHDHLDYHKTMDEYFRCKSVLFDMLRSSGGAQVINIDDPWGRRLKGANPGATTFSLGDGSASVRAKSFSLLEDRTEAVISTPAGEAGVEARLVGEYNLQNILCAMAVAVSLGIDPLVAARGIGKLERVPGRLEKLVSGGNDPFRAYVDYAHTPDALERALAALRPVTRGRLITVFGCGGNRDRKKRPRMGEAAARQSDIVIVTSDNPRDEDPIEIISEIEAGMKGIRKFAPGERPAGKGYMVVPDRREALRKAASIAGKGDTILAAGKGHEDYQLIKGVKHHFDDYEELRSIIHGNGLAAGQAL